MQAQILFNQQSCTGNIGILLNFIYKNGLKFLILIPSYIFVVYVCDSRNLCYKSHIWRFFRGGGCLLFSKFILILSLVFLFATHSLLHPPKDRGSKVFLSTTETERMPQYVVRSQKREISSIKLHQFPIQEGKEFLITLRNKICL